MVQKEGLTAQLAGFVKTVSDKVRVERVVLFGSRARGKHGPYSDYDLIVVSKEFEGKKFYKRPGMLYKYWDIDAPVDFICLTPAEFSRKLGEVNIVSQAAKTGVQIS